MAIFPNRPAPFTCAICNKEAKADRWRYAALYDYPPVCWNCEQEFGTGQYADLNPDRRLIKQISALSHALKIDAHRISIEEGHSYG